MNYPEVFINGIQVPMVLSWSHRQRFLKTAVWAYGQARPAGFSLGENGFRLSFTVQWPRGILPIMRQNFLKLTDFTLEVREENGHYYFTKVNWIEWEETFWQEGRKETFVAEGYSMQKEGSTDE